MLTYYIIFLFLVVFLSMMSYYLITVVDDVVKMSLIDDTISEEAILNELSRQKMR